jgi:hypothetical protein
MVTTGWHADSHPPAFRDRQAGSYNNRSRPVDEHKDAQRRGIRARDDRGARVRNDRHSRTGHTYASLWHLPNGLYADRISLGIPTSRSTRVGELPTETLSGTMRRLVKPSPGLMPTSPRRLERVNRLLSKSRKTRPSRTTSTSPSWLRRGVRTLV